MLNYSNLCLRTVTELTWPRAREALSNRAHWVSRNHADDCLLLTASSTIIRDGLGFGIEKLRGRHIDRSRAVDYPVNDECSAAKWWFWSVSQFRWWKLVVGLGGRRAKWAVTFWRARASFHAWDVNPAELQVRRTNQVHLTRPSSYIHLHITALSLWLKTLEMLLLIAACKS